MTPRKRAYTPTGKPRSQVSRDRARCIWRAWSVWGYTIDEIVAIWGKPDNVRKIIREGEKREMEQTG